MKLRFTSRIMQINISCNCHNYIQQHIGFILSECGLSTSIPVDDIF